MIVYGTVLVIHVLLSLFLVTVVLLQGGRGGLGEALGGAAAQSLFGGGANTVITKITTVIAVLFMVTCLSLAALSTARGRSVIDQIPASLPAGLPALPGTLPAESTGPASPSATDTQPSAPATPTPPDRHAPPSP